MERLAAIAERQPGTTAGDVGDREVGGIAAITESEHVCRFSSRLLEQRVDRHSIPLGVQLGPPGDAVDKDRKSTRLNSSHLGISYAVFCLKKKIKQRK